MSQNISLWGASYSNVPSVTLPKTGGGTASFTDVTDTTATASDVASGKYFYTAAGVKTQGTSTSGGYITQDANGYVVLSSTNGVPTLISKTITESGTYNPASDGATGYSSVTVNTPSYGILTVTASSSATYPKKLTFSNVSGEPTAFYLYIARSFNGGTNSVIVARYDGTNLYWVYLASNSSAYYEQINTGGFSYSNHTLSIYISTGSDSDYGVRFHPGANYELIYFY